MTTIRDAEARSRRRTHIAASHQIVNLRRVDGFRGAARTALLRRIERRLAAGVLMRVEDIDAALAFLRSIEKPLMGLSVSAVTSAVRTEQIAIELDALGIAA